VIYRPNESAVLEDENVKRILAIACCLLFIASLSNLAGALPGDTASADHTAPSYDMKAQSLLDLERVQQRFVIWPMQFLLTSSHGGLRRMLVHLQKYFFMPPLNAMAS
jgi:hypothetical protein